MAEKEIINISIKLFWDDNSSATFNGPLEFTTTLNHGCTTIKNLDIPSTVLLNGKSYQRIADEPIHSDIYNLLNNISLEEEANTAQQSEDNQKSISKFFKATKRNQVVNSRENIHKEQDEIIDDNGEPSKVNEQLSEIQVEADDQQSDDPPFPEKNSKPLKDESTSSDATIEELQLSTRLLNNNFEIVQKNKLIVYGNKLFSKNKSIEDLLITNFSHLFNNINVINYSFLPLPSYSLNMELLKNYFKEWASQYGQLKSTKTEVEEKMLKLLYELRGTYLTLLVMLAEEYKRDKNRYSTHKTLRGFVNKKVKSILGISKRHEQRYWVGTWRLIELLNITHCPVSILIESDLTVRYLMRNANYDQFLQSLLNNVEINHEAPKFSESLILRGRNDGGVNIRGCIRGVEVVIQCKNYKEEKPI
ncbi:13197_t:CDS:2, partial [Gigaspora margarita]